MRKCQRQEVQEAVCARDRGGDGGGWELQSRVGKAY